MRGALRGGQRLRHARVEARAEDVGGDALGVDEAFEERVGREPVGAVHAGAGDLAARVQAGHRGASVGVGADAARGVVGGGGDRDGLGDRVDAVGAAGGQDRREAALPHLGAEVAGVEVHVLGVVLPHAAHDALGDDVARGQLGQFVLPEHEAHAVGVDQVGALAAHRLGDQRLLTLRVRAEEEHRGVELDELQVAHLGARAQREGDAVAGGDGRVGGRGEHLAHAAGGEHHGGRVHRAHAVVLALPHDVQGDAGGAALGVGEEVEDESVLDGAQPAGTDRLDQGTGDLRAGGVAARVGDAAAVVAALAGEFQVALGGRVEPRAGRDQPPYGVGALGDEDAHRLLVAQARAGDQGVVEVLLGGVALAEGRGDAALRPAGRAVVETRLGDHHGGQARRPAAQGGGETGDAGADDHHVRVDGPPGRRRVQAGAGAGRRRGGRAYACAGHEASPSVPKVRGGCR